MDAELRQGRTSLDESLVDVSRSYVQLQATAQNFEIPDGLCGFATDHKWTCNAFTRNTELLPIRSELSTRSYLGLYNPCVLPVLSHASGSAAINMLPAYSDGQGTHPARVPQVIYTYPSCDPVSDIFVSTPPPVPTLNSKPHLYPGLSRMKLPSRETDHASSCLYLPACLEVHRKHHLLARLRVLQVPMLWSKHLLYG